MFFDYGSVDPDDPSIPEFMREHIRAAQQAAITVNMERDLSQHERSRVWETFTEEQLCLLRNIFNGVSVGEDPTRMAGYLNGYTVGILERKFGVCPIHQVNHEAELLGAAMDGMPDAPPAEPTDGVAS